MNDTDEFFVVMRDTRARFVAGFPDQLAHMRSMGADTSTAPNLPALRTVAHRLAGLSGTIGFTSVGSAAAELESLIDDALETGDFDRNAALTIIQTIGDAFTRDLAMPPSWAAPPVRSPSVARIMIIEDDDDQRALVRAYLEKGGFETIALATGDAALETARRERPGLILLDVHLPGMDGYSVCRLLKADRDTHTIPVVFVTTRASLNERLAGLTLGADDYLTKPVDMGELLLRVRRLARVPDRRAAQSPAAAETNLRSYEDWLDAARGTLASGPAAIAMLRVPQPRQQTVMPGLSENLRRRDVLAVYDRAHLLVLMPEMSAERASELLREVLSTPPLAADKIHAGVAAGMGADPEALVAEADEALATARHTGELVSRRATDARHKTIGSSQAVLLADDDPDVMRIVDAHMQGLGFRTVIAFDGQAAIAGLAAKPDAVVLDLMMPKVTGFEVLQRIARLDPPRPKVIVLSGRGREEDVTRAFDLGADDYIVKPFSPQELGARLARLLR